MDPIIQKIQQFKRETREHRIATRLARWKYCNLPESVLGYYNTRLDIAYVNSSFEGMDDYVFTVVCHELHHRWQYQTWGPWSYTFKKFLRFPLERTADEIERAASAWIGLEGLES